MSQELAFVQVRELLKKNYIEDRRNPRRTCCEHFCPMLMAILIGKLIGESQQRFSADDRPMPNSPNSDSVGGVFHQLDYSYVHDPLNRILAKSMRSRYSGYPCGDCGSKIVLQGKHGVEFKEFLKQRSAGARGELCPFDSIVTGKTVEATFGMCAAVVWPGDDPTVYTVRTNRTYGYLDDNGRFQGRLNQGSGYENYVWSPLPGYPLAPEELKAKRCVSKASTAKCKIAFNKMYAPPQCYAPSYYGSDESGSCENDERDPWFVSLDLLVHEFLEQQRYKSGKKPIMGFHFGALNGKHDECINLNSQCARIKDGSRNCNDYGLKAACCDCEGGVMRTQTEYMVVAAPAVLSKNEVDAIIKQSGPGGMAEQAYKMMMGVQLNLVNIVLFFTVISRTIKEREEKLKEGLRMMGTSNTAYYGHWFLYSCMAAAFHAIFLFGSWTYFQVFSNTYLSFLLFAFLFYANIHAFALLLSCFFSQPRNGSLIGTMIFLMATFVSIVPLRGGADMLLLLVPQVAWTKYITCFKSGDTEGWPDDLEIDGGLSMGTCQFWMFFDFFMLHLLWIYFDMVIPHENSSNQQPWYLCDPGYWRGTQGVVDAADENREAVEMTPMDTGDSPARGFGGSSPASEPMVVRQRMSVDETLSEKGRATLFEPPNAEDIANVSQQRCVTVKNLCVYFKGVHGEDIKAVDGVSFFMYPNEVFCLLGHNGAGKSTTMSVIAGMLKCTKGQVTVYGKRVPQEMDAVRKKMGFCPQHDVLFADLTVREHIELFSKITGREQATLDSMNELVRAVGLGERANYLTTALSGGMKRKLSVGITFSGDPNLVILDEPTSGMDPFSRRVLWDFLKLRKEGRVLLLTTHFMDEADVLGDRIAIMRAGEVQTCGSSQFLKRKFGCGYVLTVVMSEDKKELHEPVKALISQTVQDDRIEFSSVGKEILANIPFDCETKLPDTLSAMGRDKDSLKIATFGISLTNLEEVFLKVASGDHANKAQADETNRSFTQESDLRGESTEAAFVMPNPGGSIPEQMYALLIRRQQSAIRDLKAFVIGCFVPVLMVLGSCMLGKMLINASVPSSSPLPEVEIALDNIQVTYAVASLDADATGFPQGATVLGKDVGTRFQEGSNRDRIFNCVPGVPRGNNAGPRTCSFEDKAQDFRLPRTFLATCMEKGNTEDYCRGFFFHNLLNFDEALAKKDNDIGVALIDGYPVVSLNNTHVAHATPLAVKELFKWTGAGEVKVSNNILERTPAEKEFLKASTVQFQAIANMIIAILSNFAFCFVPIAVLGFVLMEKAKDVKHQLLISGCSAKAYWVSMLIWDCMIGVFPVMMLYVFLWSFGFEAFIRYASASCTILLLFVPAAISLAYVLTHCIDGPNMGNTCLLLCNGICALMLVMLFIMSDLASKALPVFTSLTMETRQVQAPSAFMEQYYPGSQKKPSPDDPIMRLNSTQFAQDFIEGRCGPLKSAYAQMEILCRDTPDDLGNKCYNNPWLSREYDNLRQMYNLCDIVWWSQTMMPIVKTVGSTLPGFNLLDGLLRIAGRHALVYLLLPEGVRMLGSGVESQIKQQIESSLASCGTPMQPQKLPTDMFDTNALKEQCDDYQTKAQGVLTGLEKSDKKCIIQLPGLANLEQLMAGGMMDQLNGLQFSRVIDHIANQHPDEEARPILRQALEERVAAFTDVGRRLAESRRLGGGNADQIHQMMANIHSQIYQIALEILLSPEGPMGWIGVVKTPDLAMRHMATCISQVPGGDSLALAAILSAHGSAIAGKVKDMFDKTAASPTFVDFADRFLPVIATRKKDIFGGRCDWGPEFGPWVMGKLLPQGFGEVLGPTVNSTLFGPVRVTMPCDFGLQGNDIADGIGGVIEVLVLIPTVGDSMLRLAILAIVYTLLAIVLEDLKQSPRFAMWMANKEPCPEHMLTLEDENVKAEKERVDRVDPSKQIMFVRRLRKVFGGGRCGGKSTHAVRGVTWAADKGMVFGLLGVNGAGKTTSFKMMSGILTPSDGEVRILGINVLHETARARRFIGYCPQFDALIERLTVIEHLYLYGRMKGVKGQDLGKAVDHKLTEMQLKQYTTRRSGSLSGGNKRKLSVAMAIIGEPPVIFLDEPSTGMDPFARRFMWGVIQDVAEKRKQSVVVLTTHSMEEAEALCSCIAIQVDGQLRCLGSAQQLKSQYGQGYEVSVKFSTVADDILKPALDEWGVADPTSMVSVFACAQRFDQAKDLACKAHGGPFADNVQEVSARILIEWSVVYDRLQKFETFLINREPGSVFLIEAHGLSAKWRLTDMVEMGLAALMKDIQSIKAENGISDFACNQASLEQIFNAFAAQQEAAMGPSRTEPARVGPGSMAGPPNVPVQVGILDFIPVQ